MDILEIVPGVHRIELSLGERIICSYAVVGDERVLVVDTGLRESIDAELLPYLAQAGIDAERVEFVLISHADVDHSGGNGQLARSVAAGAKFICHDLDQRMIADVGVLTRERYECFREGYGIDFGEAFSQWVHDNAEHVAIDITLQGGERLRLGGDISVDILHTPGHSRGHLSLWLADRRTAIICDAVLGRNVPTADGRPFSPPTYRYVDSYLGTIARLQSMDIDVLLTGHNPVLRGADVQQFLADSRAFVDELDAYILRLLDGASLTTPELIGRIDPGPFGWPVECHTNLIFPVAGHLERLEANGVIEADRSQALTIWGLGP
jgi:glyoxylase-like metal-dependent hydrolase (beta-lactamase superfamily II)